MTKIDIISGFLGAGKTTFIKKLIQEAFVDEHIVLIENEFGEIGIDGGFLNDAGIEIREMNSGCICCSLVGDFREALKKVIADYTPDRIIIEPSGVGKLSDVIQSVQDIAEELHISLHSYTTVVDAQKCKMYMKNFGEFFNNQITYAQTILLSRTQNLDDEKLAAVVHELRHYNEKAKIVTTPWDQIDGHEILKVMETTTLETELFMEHDVCPTCGHHHDHEEEHHHEHYHDHDHDCDCGHDHHHADEVFTSWGMETPKKYTKQELEHILQALSQESYGTILRAKGMLESKNGGWYYFDFVPEEYEIREGKPTYTGRFCVIGAQLKEDALKTLFHVA